MEILSPSTRTSQRTHDRRTWIGVGCWWVGSGPGWLVLVTPSSAISGSRFLRCIPAAPRLAGWTQVDRRASSRGARGRPRQRDTSREPADRAQSSHRHAVEDKARWLRAGLAPPWDLVVLAGLPFSSPPLWAWRAVQTAFTTPKSWARVLSAQSARSFGAPALCTWTGLASGLGPRSPCEVWPVACEPERRHLHVGSWMTRR